ncbi:hypothetical protein C4552_01760 [Candidatus Parcubacteria bacterium]|nr:MAG: hypothetical protein C4552_01760 [Candidatus Parcubacteria bacterium]
MRAILFIGLALLLAFGPLAALAAGPVGNPALTGPQDVQINTTKYLGNLYLWMLGFVGIAAFFAIVYGGVLYMFSGPNITKVDQAKTWIQNAIFGILLAAASYVILNTINPALVNHNFDLETMIKDALK